MPRSIENLLMSFEEMEAAENCSNQATRRSTPFGPVTGSPMPDFASESSSSRRNSFSSRQEAELFVVKRPGRENPRPSNMPDNSNNLPAFDFSELAQQSGGGRFSFTAGVSRPVTMYNESDWMTEPDSLPDVAPRTAGHFTTSGSYRPPLPVRPNRLVAKVEGGSQRRVGSTHLQIGIDGIPPVPRVDYAAHSGDHHSAGQKRLYSERDEPLTPTIRVIKHNHTIPMPGLTSPQRAFSNSRDELTYPSLAPEDLHVVKRHCSRMTDSNRTASTNVTVIRHYSAQVPPSEVTDTDLSHTGTVIVRVPIQQQQNDGEADLSSFNYGSTLEGSSRILPSPSSDVLRPAMMQRTHRPSPISVPPRTTFMPADIMAARSPLDAIVPLPVDYTSTHMGGGDVSRDNSSRGVADAGRGNVRRGNNKTGSLLKRMGTVGKSVRISEWLATVRSRSGRIMTSAGTALQDVQLPLHLPSRGFSHKKNSQATINSRNQLFGSQIMTDIGLASQPSTTALENPFLYTKSRCKVAVLYRVVLGLIMVPGLGFVVGVFAVKGYLDKMVALISDGDIKSFTYRQRTVMVRVISWVIVFTIAASAMAILAVLFLKGELENGDN